MALIVQKYGGTSVGTIEKIRNVAKRVARTKDQGNDVVVVVSAMSGETNRLLGLAHQISEMPNERELDVVASTGEQVTIGLLAIALTELGYKARSFCGFQIPVLTPKRWAYSFNTCGVSFSGSTLMLTRRSGTWRALARSCAFSMKRVTRGQMVGQRVNMNATAHTLPRSESLLT